MKKSLLVAAIALGLNGCAHMPGAQTNSGWTTLVDGTGMTNFEPVGDANWRIVDGAIVADKGTGFLVTRESYGDFMLKAEFYAEADTNSGIFIRCNDRLKLTAATCYEVNIWDKRPAPEYGTGAIVDLVKVSNPMPKAGGRWNTYEITAKGDHFTVMLNGVKTAEGRDAKLARGPIGLQYAPGTVKDSGLPIKWRKVQIRPL